MAQSEKLICFSLVPRRPTPGKPNVDMCSRLSPALPRPLTLTLIKRSVTRAVLALHTRSRTDVSLGASALALAPSLSLSLTRGARTEEASSVGMPLMWSVRSVRRRRGRPRTASPTDHHSGVKSSMRGPAVRLANSTQYSGAYLSTKKRPKRPARAARRCVRRQAVHPCGNRLAR